MKSKHSEMGLARQNQVQNPVKLFKKLCSYSVHNATQYYTVIHEKTWQYICDRNSRKTRLIFVIFALL